MKHTKLNQEAYESTGRMAMSRIIKSAIALTGLLAVGLATSDRFASEHVVLGALDATVTSQSSGVEALAQATLHSEALHAQSAVAVDIAAPATFAAGASDSQMASLPSAESARRSANSSASAPSDVEPASKMSGRVAAIAAAGGNQPVEIIVRYEDQPELFDDARVAALGGEVVRGYDSLAMRAIRIPAGALQELAIEQTIEWLSLDEKVSSTSFVSRQTANLPTAGSANAAYAGQGVGVAIIDSGVSKHSDLNDGVLQYDFLGGSFPQPDLANGEVLNANSQARDDKFGHGTHVAGLIAGSGGNSLDQYRGASKGAQILALRVLDGNGEGQSSDVIAALDWLVTYGSYFDIRVANLSLGKNVSESNNTDPLVIAAEAVWDAGIVVIAAAGNDGGIGNMTINSPGNSRKLISVGSLTDNGTGSDYSDDYVSSFSSLGPSAGDLVLKPDLVAPGNRLVAAIPKTSMLGKLLQQRRRSCLSSACEDGYLEMSGTSMAAPMVTSAVALMLQKDPSLTPATVKARLMRSARKLPIEPTSIGAGVLDIDAALNDSGYVSGEALSPLMIRDPNGTGILVEDTGMLWGDSLWSAGYVFSGGFNWPNADAGEVSSVIDANGYLWTDTGVGANGFLWTDEDISANGFLWTDEGVWANGFLWTDEDSVWSRGFLWTDEVGSRGVMETDGESFAIIHDDP